MAAGDQTMKLDADFPLILEAVARGERKRKTIVARGTVTVDLPEYTEGEAPVALTVEDRTSSMRFRIVEGACYRRADAFKPEGGRMRFRFKYASTVDCLDLYRGVQERLIGAISHARAGGPVGSRLAPAALVDFVQRRTYHRDDFVEFDPVGEVVPDHDAAEVARQEEAFRRHLENFILVDGVAHVRTFEPFYVVRVGSAESGPAVFAHSQLQVYEVGERFASREGSACFRADELNEAIACAVDLKQRQLAGRPGETQPEVRGRIVVHDGTGLAFDAAAASLLMTAIDVKSGFLAAAEPSEDKPDAVATVSALLDGMSLEGFAAYRGLTDAIASGAPDRVAEAITRFVDAGLALSDPEGTWNAKGTDMIARYAVERWHNRGISLDLGEKQARFSHA
jgi:hypothetical protein